MPRPRGSKNVRTLDFEKKFNKCVREYGDPMVYLFEVVFKKRVPVTEKISAARILNSQDPRVRRFLQQVKLEEETAQQQTEFEFGWSDDAPDAARTIQ